MSSKIELNFSISMSDYQYENMVRNRSVRKENCLYSIMETEDYITDEMITELKDVYSDSIDAIAISESVGDGTIKSGSDSANISISGINKDYFKSKKIIFQR